MSTIINNDTDHRLASRLHDERETRGWTLAELAERSGVSRGMVSKIERGEASPTAALLGRLSAAFGLTLAEIFTDPERHRGQLNPRSEQATWRDPETGFLRRALSPPGATAFDLTWGELPAAAEISYPAAAFTLIDEQQVIVLDGQLTILQGSSAHTLETGDCLRFGPPQPSSFRNAGNVLCQYIVATLRAKPHRP